MSEPPHRTAELPLILLTGAGHVLVEVCLGGAHAGASAGTPERIYNLIVGVLWTLYILGQLIQSPTLLAQWGFRCQGFWASLRRSSWFILTAIAFLLTFGLVRRQLPTPSTSWAAFILYPLYGTAQQFVLQVLITRNLRPRIPALWTRALVSGLLFSAVHIPSLSLVLLTFPAGIVFSWIYEKHRNLWAIGMVHGILGALAYYTVLGLDPGAEILAIF